MRSFFSKLFLFLLLLSIACSDTESESMTPEQYAKQVSDIIVRGTEFSFEPELQKFEQDGLYLYDFPSDKKGVFYARSVLKVNEEAKLETGTKLGITFDAGDIEIFVDGDLKYSNSLTKDGHFDYVDYNLFEFEGYVPINLEDGEHDLGIKFTPKVAGNNRVSIAFIREDNGLSDPAISVHGPSQSEELEEFGYWWIGPFKNDDNDSKLLASNLTVEELLEQHFDVSNEILRWDVPKLHLVKGLPGWLTFQNWHYSGGTFLDAMANVSQHFSGLDYTDYINEHTDFFKTHINEIGQMRGDYGLIESPFGHYFRFSLLDDMGMQTVPFVNSLIATGYENIDQDSFEYQLAKRVSDHILNTDSRLEDGTFARFTPDTMSVWADDLFMSSIIQLKMYDLTKEEQYLDQVIFQTIMFDKYLLNVSDNLYWHGYFSRNEVNSSTKWGRANGWTIMTNVELLKRLPESHSKYNEILEIFVRHCEGLLAVQSKDGRWHQVLDDDSSYLETSATAMFVRGFAAGINRGWLDRETYGPAVESGWDALTRQFDEDGNVTGIVRGTPIMFSDEEYDNWGTRINDPRGLGALLYAAIEVDEFQSGGR